MLYGNRRPRTSAAAADWLDISAAGELLEMKVLLAASIWEGRRPRFAPHRVGALRH